MDGLQHLYAAPPGLALGTVTDVNDPHRRGRVKVRLAATGVEVWAPCVVASAGPDRGVALLPKTAEIVMVAFLTPDQPFVLGSVWSGQNSQPDEAAPVDERYAIKTAAKTVMLFDDAGPSFSVTTANKNAIALTDAGDKCTITVGATTVEATASGVSVTTSGSIALKASALTVDAATVTVNAGMSKFSGVVQCDTMIANAVVGTSYTPGAGNIW